MELVKIDPKHLGIGMYQVSSISTFEKFEALNYFSVPGSYL